MGKAHSLVLSHKDLDLVLGPAIYGICELEYTLCTLTLTFSSTGLV